MPTSVLFICDDNTILGPMAEAFLKRHGWPEFVAYSAGILVKPIHRYTFRVMEEIGYDLYGSRARSIFEFNQLQHVDFLITLTSTIQAQYVFNEDHIGSLLHWPFRNPLVESWETPEEEQRCAGTLPPFEYNSIDISYWLAANNTVFTTQPRNKIVFQGNTENQPPQYDVQHILKRFRKVRDEIECQVMNWIEEQGMGPLWWRR